MNENVKQKWANRSAYVILALLLITVLVVTITAIASTVAKRNEEPVPPIDAGQDGGQNGDGGSGGEQGATPSEPETPNGGSNGASGSDQHSGTDDKDQGNGGGDTPSDADQYEKIYLTPCDGEIQKDYCDDMLVFSQTMNDYRVHMGIDISGELGSPVRAFSDGVIERIYNDPFMGKTIVINHGNGLRSYYMNLSDTLPDGIAEGVTVTPGTLIGAIGETARRECADSPHLHFELTLNEKLVDPRSYIEKK